MPFRRTGSRFSRFRAAAAPPVPPPPADPLPGLRDKIDKAYREYAKLVTADAEKRADALIKVLEHLDVVARLAVVRRVAPPEAPRLWDVAAKCRARALGTTFSEEKETAIRMALGRIDKIVTKLNVRTFESADGDLKAAIAAHAEMIAAREAAREAVRVARAAAKAAERAAARESARQIPHGSPRSVIVPNVPPTFVPPVTVPPVSFAEDAPLRSPYTVGSARDIMFRKLVDGWVTSAEVLVAAAGSCKDPKGVWSANFLKENKRCSARNKNGYWKVIRESDKFRIVVPSSDASNSGEVNP
jgi:hypothetical protein